MRRDTLAGFFRDYISAPGARDRMFIVHDDGFRTRRWTYGQIAAAASAFAARLGAGGLKPGEKVVLWSENRGEWVAALWGIRLAGLVAVPVDFRASAEQAHRIRDIVQARVMLIGDEVKPNAAAGFEIWRMDDEHLWSQNQNPRTEPGEPMERVEPAEPRLAEIIFTSGATSEPKGVTLTDKNILANINPIEEEIGKYRRYLRPVAPLRFLNLLPLSHMFGQSMATFVPPMVAGTVVFSHGYNPQEIARQIRTRRISVLVCVPKVLDVLREHVERNTNREKSTGKNIHWLRRWWIHREAHRMFGWKFWCIVVGGAPLEPALEDFWRERGFLVIQGYGLTETAPVVTLNHPLKKAAAGTVGTAISGVEIKIADDGEILVRGDNVTSGYYDPSTSLGASPSSAAGASAPSDTFRDGWFHTGDMGSLDAEGRLTIKGRKKEMIVTADGLNIFPDDVERAINAQPGVLESAVVGVIPAEGAGREERVHAVLVLADGASPDAVVRSANAALENHQRIWSWSVWHGDALPRTEGTRKLRRKEIQRWAQSGAAPGTGATEGQSVEQIVSAALGGRAVTRTTTFEELSLGSLDRVQLLARIEEAFRISIDEGRFAAVTTIGELAALVEPAQPAEQRTELREPRVRRLRQVPDIRFPKWNRSLPARAVRRVSLPTWVLGVSRVWMSLEVEGLENLEGLEHPVIFAPNHQSHMDTPALLQALPNKWRYRVAPAMAKEWFKAHFFPRDYPLKKRIPNSLSYYAASLFYNCFPIPQYEGGTRQTIRYIGSLFDQKHSLLIFPEGKRTDYGEINVFRPGVGLIASKLGVPVVPVRIEGLDKVLHLSAGWPTRGPARITFGKPMHLEGDNYAELAAKVRDAVVALQPYSGPDAGSVAQYLSERKGKALPKLE